MVALKLPAPLVSLGLTSLKPDSFAFADMVVLPSSALVLTIVRPRTAVTASARTAQIGLIRHLPLTRRGVTSKARPPAPTPGVCPHYRGGLHLWGIIWAFQPTSIGGGGYGRTTGGNNPAVLRFPRPQRRRGGHQGLHERCPSSR